MKFMRHSNRNQLRTSDIDSALHVRNVEVSVAFSVVGVGVVGVHQR